MIVIENNEQRTYVQRKLGLSESGLDNFKRRIKMSEIKLEDDKHNKNFFNKDMKIDAILKRKEVVAREESSSVHSLQSFMGRGAFRLGISKSNSVPKLR